MRQIISFIALLSVLLTSCASLSEKQPIETSTVTSIDKSNIYYSDKIIYRFWININTVYTIGESYYCVGNVSISNGVFSIQTVDYYGIKLHRSEDEKRTPIQDEEMIGKIKSIKFDRPSIVLNEESKTMVQGLMEEWTCSNYLKRTRSIFFYDYIKLIFKIFNTLSDQTESVQEIEINDNIKILTSIKNYDITFRSFSYETSGASFTAMIKELD